MASRTISKTCSIDGCDKKFFAKGLCKMHVTRLDRHGDPLYTLRDHGTGATSEERFWSRVALTADGGKCWNWQGKSTSHGYGHLRFKRRDVRAHRLAWFLTSGEWPKLFLLHSCDNRLCVNPSHLREGTQLENMQDAIDRDRVATGERQGNVKLTWSKVAEIRSLLKTGAKQKILANQFNVSPTAISCINLGKTWRENESVEGSS